MNMNIRTPKASLIMDEDDEESADETNALTLKCLDQECCWVQHARALKTLDDVEAALFECMGRLNSTKKLSKSPQLSSVAPELRTINLMSLLNRDTFSVSVTMLAEDLQSAKVSFKHIRASGGVYKAQLKSPYKLQQLQNCANKIARTMRTLNESRAKLIKTTKDSDFNRQTGNYLTVMLTEIRDQIKSCIRSLSPPNVRNYWGVFLNANQQVLNLLELHNSSVMGYFDPPPPSDLLFSFYVSTDRLVCTAYQIAPKQGNSHSLISYHVESRLDTLAQLHELLGHAHWIATSLLISLNMFNAYQSHSAQ